MGMLSSRVIPKNCIPGTYSTSTEPGITRRHMSAYTIEGMFWELVDLLEDLYDIEFAPGGTPANIITSHQAQWVIFTCTQKYKSYSRSYLYSMTHKLYETFVDIELFLDRNMAATYMSDRPDQPENYTSIYIDSALSINSNYFIQGVPLRQLDKRAEIVKLWDGEHTGQFHITCSPTWIGPVWSDKSIKELNKNCATALKLKLNPSLYNPATLDITV